jgi:hypothetical protein
MNGKKMLDKKKKKKSWVHPFISDRSESGLFYNLHGDLRNYPVNSLIT